MRPSEVMARTRSVRPPASGAAGRALTAAIAAISPRRSARGWRTMSRSPVRVATTPRRSPRRRMTMPSPASTSRASSSLVWPSVPKAIDGDRSTRAQAVSTGSISGTRTIGVASRALRGQLTQRTSSPSS